MTVSKPTVPLFNEDSTVQDLYRQPVVPGSFPEPAGLPFPDPLPPPGEHVVDWALADQENWVPPEGVGIACQGCRHFWHTKQVAVSWSNREPSKRRKEGRAMCLLVNPPIDLGGAYITDCNRKETP